MSAPPRRLPRRRIELPQPRCVRCGALSVLPHYKICQACFDRRFGKLEDVAV
jgi:uncharacterized OB-fold protein